MSADDLTTAALLSIVDGALDDCRIHLGPLTRVRFRARVVELADLADLAVIRRTPPVPEP